MRLLKYSVDATLQRFELSRLGCKRVDLLTSYSSSSLITQLSVYSMDETHYSGGEDSEYDDEDRNVDYQEEYQSGSSSDEEIGGAVTNGWNNITPLNFDMINSSNFDMINSIFNTQQ
ncbi:hypothetical protein L6452_38748 [Arctium lappa]|uniref:Uncharacterized protein n=1 Tax=Arctium lappa TaxID=4217 RepID=A0ACB8XQD3_ARCLA|nr:hypothetical protein L6452_38748 [Arctium lappa]